jgi:hypothetical protein
MATPTNIAKVLEGVCEHIKQFINTNTSFEISSCVRIFNQQDAFNQEFFKDNKIIYPFISYQAKSVSLAVDRMGSSFSRKKGFALSNITFNSYPKANDIQYAVDVTTQKVKHADNLFPVDCSLTLTFHTNTPQHFDEFIVAWLSTYPVISFYVPFAEGIEFPVTIVPTYQDLTYPDKETDDRGDYYRGEVNMLVQTFIGTVSDVAFIKPDSASPLTTTNVVSKNNESVPDIIKITNT